VLDPLFVALVLATGPALLGGRRGLLAWRIRGYRRLAEKALDDPALRRQAIERLSEAQVMLRLKAASRRQQDLSAEAVERREEAELRVCLAELLLAEDRAEDASAELFEPAAVELPPRRAELRARIAHEIAVRLALARGEAEHALTLLEGHHRPALRLCRARALALLDRASDEVWRLLSEQPEGALAEYARRHPDEPAAVVARRILDGAGAYR
jgi:hypothetical protein